MILSSRFEALGILQISRKNDQTGWGFNVLNDFIRLLVCDYSPPKGIPPSEGMPVAGTRRFYHNSFITLSLAVLK